MPKPKKPYETRFYTFHPSFALVFGIIFLATLIFVGIFVNQKFDDPNHINYIMSATRSDERMDVNWGRYPTFDIELSESLTITKSGTYHFTGTLADGQITIDSNNICVRLILDNVSIHNSSGPAIYSINADELAIETIGNNYLSDGAEYSSDYDDKVTATIYSRNDLTFQGEGSLDITAKYANAISSRDDLTINSGSFELSAADDGIHASDKLIINGGAINITKSHEGIESRVVVVNDGNISVKAIDDGFNAGSGASNTSHIEEDCILAFNGGNIYINAAGDGIDSNGYIYISGGYLAIDGPTNDNNSAIDFGTNIIMNGGTVIAVGSSGMAETLGSVGSVLNVSIYFSANQPAGTNIEIKNSADETILEHTSAKAFTNITAGLPAFKLGETYTLYLDGEPSQTFLLTDTTTTIGTNNHNRFPLSTKMSK